MRTDGMVWLSVVGALGLVVALAGCSGRAGADTSQVAKIPATAPTHGPAIGSTTVQDDSPVKTSAAKKGIAVDWAAQQHLWDASMMLPGINTGPVDSTKRMLVFFDPDCHVCAEQWMVLKPYLHTVRIRWIPVAFMDKDSLRRAAAILAAHDPVAAFMENEFNFNFKADTGSYPIPHTIPDWALRAVESNTHSPAFLQSFAAIPKLGFEFYKDRRYLIQTGLMDGKDMLVITQELGDTMDPYARTAQLMGRAGAAAATRSGISH